MKKMDEKKLKEDSGFPYGWNKGDTCVMITNKTKKSTCEYTVESYDEVILDFIIEFHRGECFVQGRRRLKHY